MKVFGQWLQGIAQEKNGMSILKSVPTVNGMELNSPEKCAPYLFKQMFTKPTIEEH